ncbi:MAG: GAF domain-containing protein [Okeania sp. SIO3B3]|nr:GAF domain-containing protein [Okeania sp. SIO3B3]
MCGRLRCINKVKRSQQNLLVNNLEQDKTLITDDYLSQHQPKSLFCTPILKQGKFIGILYLENNLAAEAFTRERIVLLQTLATQAAISLENARLYDACKRFVPDQFISFLDKNSIVDVKLGDQVEREMTVLFSDIRDFTTISEKMTPAENFAFINEYLGYMEPLIQKHGGFIDKYIGDAIMALFANSVDEAVKGALAMLEELKKYNSYRQEKDLAPLRIGIGLHTGRLMLGTVGGMGRMDGTAIGDSVNLSSRVEGLTKNYGVSLLITDQTWIRLNNPLEYDFRFIEQVKAKGKTKSVALFEVFSADPPELKEAKIVTKEKFEKAVLLYYQRSFLEAAHLFKECLEYHSGDRAARSYLERCNRHN